MADDHAVLEHERAVPAVRIQFNYAGYDDPAVQSRACYEVCRKYDKPVIVMEPVKGGNLVRLPEDAKAVLDARCTAAARQATPCALPRASPAC